MSVFWTSWSDVYCSTSYSWNLEWIGRKNLQRERGILRGYCESRHCENMCSVTSKPGWKIFLFFCIWLFFPRTLSGHFGRRRERKAWKLGGVCFSQRGSQADFTIKQQIWCPPVPPLTPHHTPPHLDNVTDVTDVRRENKWKPWHRSAATSSHGKNTNIRFSGF